MEFINFGSGSSGNLYVLKHDDELVILECGFEFDTIIKKLNQANLSIQNVKAVITSHNHSDHIKGLSGFQNYGFDCYYAGNIKDGQSFSVSDWLKVKPFLVNHDIEAYGFIFLDTKNNESMLFINDTAPFDFDFKGVYFDKIAIECNFIRDLVLQAYNKTNSFKYLRQSNYHLGLDDTINMLKMMNLEKTKAIYLMHQSHECGNTKTSYDEISKEFNIKTYVCLKTGGFYG